MLRQTPTNTAFWLDRLWPRGLTKEKTAVDFWAKYIAPTNELRKWFHQHPGNRIPFEKKYTKELSLDTSMPQFIDAIKAQKKVTLPFSPKETEQNNATVLKDFLNKK